MPEVGPRPRAGCITLVIVVLLLFIGARSLAAWALEYQWWREMGHVDTWIALWIYAVGPGVAVALITPPAGRCCP